jgi:dinuclear metal center YbgI/SA1388 family protein
VTTNTTVHETGCIGGNNTKPYNREARALSFPAMAPLAEILAHVDELLEIAAFEDYGPNGLQVPGAADVELVVSGVSGQAELFERAAAAGAQMVLVHHGILWDFQPRRIDRVQARRLRALLANDISLVAYHLPLDAHPVLGNNALIATALGCEDDGREPFGHAKGRPVGVEASFPDPGIASDELVGRVRGATGREPLAFLAGPDRVRRIGIVSGAAAEMIQEAIERGLDAFLTGEPAEHVMATAREAGIHFLAAGHYATETFGVRRIGELIAERFGIAHEFVDISNPI